MTLSALRHALAILGKSPPHPVTDYQRVSILRRVKLIPTDYFLTFSGAYYVPLPNLLSQLVLYSPIGSERSELQRAATEKLQQLRTSIAWAIRSPHSAIDLEAIESFITISP